MGNIKSYIFFFLGGGQKSTPLIVVLSHCYIIRGNKIYCVNLLFNSSTSFSELAKISPPPPTKKHNINFTRGMNNLFFICIKIIALTKSAMIELFLLLLLFVCWFFYLLFSTIQLIVTRCLEGYAS